MKTAERLSPNGLRRGKARVLAALRGAGRSLTSEEIGEVAGRKVRIGGLPWSKWYALPYLSILVADGKVVKHRHGKYIKYSPAIVGRVVVGEPFSADRWNEEAEEKPTWLAIHSRKQAAIDADRQIRINTTKVGGNGTSNTVHLRSGTLNRLRALGELMVMPVEEVIDELVEDKVRTVFKGGGK